MNKSLSIFVLTILYFWVISRIFNMYIADVYYVKSKNALTNPDDVLALKYVNNALEYNPFEPSYYRQRARTLLVSSALSSDENLKTEALENLSLAQNLNPKNLTTLRNMVLLYYYVAKDTENPIFINATKDYFSYIKETYKNDLGLYVDIAKYEKNLGFEEDYLYTVKRVKELRPDIINWHESFR